MNAAELITLSRTENRTVTEYPTAEEYELLTTDLLYECEDSADHTGQGHSGPEARGYTEYWGAGWRAAVVHPKK